MKKKALVIELIWSSPEQDWVITNASSHGNTVRNCFLAFAQAGWTCDVRYANQVNLTYVGEYDYVSKLQATPYDLVICSWRLDIYYQEYLKKIPDELGIPTFLPNSYAGYPRVITRQESPLIYTGTAPDGYGYGWYTTWDVATNLTGGNQNLASYTNGVVAGKATKLVDAGLSASAILEQIEIQASNYPNWDNISGFGKAPSFYIEPEPEPPFIPVFSTQKIAFFTQL